MASYSEESCAYEARVNLFLLSLLGFLFGKSIISSYSQVYLVRLIRHCQTLSHVCHLLYRQCFSIDLIVSNLCGKHRCSSFSRLAVALWVSLAHHSTLNLIGSLHHCLAQLRLPSCVSVFWSQIMGYFPSALLLFTVEGFSCTRHSRNT